MLATISALLASATAPPYALPSPQTLHYRLLHCSVVLRARCKKSKTKPKHFWEGSYFDLEGIEILWSAHGADKNTYRQLASHIPGSSITPHEHPIPTGCEVLIFGSPTFDGRLGLVSFCLNSVVPLRGTLDEYPGPQYAVQKIEAAAFLTQVRARLVDFADFAWLQQQFRQARGSMHPFCHADKPRLLERLLHLPDRRVAPFAAELHNRTSMRCVPILDAYFVRTKNTAPLREDYLALLQQRDAGALDGTETFRHPSGSITDRRRRIERLFDKARSLHAAGDAAFVRKSLHQLWHSPEPRAGGLLIELGDAETLSWCVRTLEARSSSRLQTQHAIDTAAFSRERTAVLACLRLAFARKATPRSALLQRMIDQGTFRWPEPPAANADQTSWQAYWRRVAPRFRRTFSKGHLDQMIGTADGWR